MTDFLRKCEEFFSTRCFYEILQIDKNASQQDIKKAYHKLSLLVHPDRVEPSQKDVATEKFKVLGKIYSILQNEDRRKVYDEQGEFDDEFDNGFNWLEYWRSMFKPISTKDIDNYKNEYIGSESEIRDIKKAYIASKGNMDVILESVMFSNCDSEPRIMEIVRKLVDDGEVEEYDAFFKEPKRKRDRRHKKWEDEKREFEKMNVSVEQLALEMQKNREEREKKFCDYMTQLENKYCKPTKRKSIKGQESAEKKARTTPRRAAKRSK